VELKERPEVLKGVTRKIRTSCGNLYVSVNYDENNNPLEIISRLGKSGGCGSALQEAIGRLSTLALGAGIPLDKIAQQLKGITCHSPCFISADLTIKSCPDAVAYSLENAKEPKNDK
jgi:ribonucleoside-diphosphate reductase alpha chain